jgi:hypothetical protein
VAELVVKGSDLVLHMPFQQKILGFHSDITVPLSAVRKAKAVDNPWMTLRGRRMAGTALRGVAAIGTWTHGDRQFDFCVLRRDSAAVLVEVSYGRFCRFLVGVPDSVDAATQAARIADAAGIAHS